MKEESEKREGGEGWKRNEEREERVIEWDARTP